MKIEINALDTLFFRDGKPFERGDENWATGTFPPMPSVIYGALRTAFLSQNSNIDIKTTEQLNLKSILIQQYIDKGKSIDKNTLFPIPLDLLYSKKEDKAKLLGFKPNNLISNKENQVLGFLHSDKSDKTEDLTGKAFLNDINFSEYLNGEQSSFKPIKTNENIILESKTGIGRNNQSGTTEDGLLYRVGMIRLQKDDKTYENPQTLKFQIDFELKDYTLNSSGFLKLGGEGKTVNYYNITDSLDIPLPEIKTNYFKVYLATPAIFENGWLPKIFQDKLITCAIGKPQMVGGFDMQKRMPKAMQKAVPAGSVYYIKTNSVESAKILANKLHSNSISEYRSKEGFGICYIGQITQNLNGI